MIEFLKSCLSRKFVSAHFGVVIIFLIAILSRNGAMDAGVSTASIVGITALLSAYQGANAVSKKYQDQPDVKP